MQKTPTRKAVSKPAVIERACIAIALLLSLPGCPSPDKIEYSRDLGNGCIQVLNENGREGRILEFRYQVLGQGEKFFPVKDQQYCDRIGVSGKYVFGEVLQYPKVGVRGEPKLAGYFAFCTEDKYVHEFREVASMESFAKETGVSSLPPFSSSVVDAKKLVWPGY